MKKDLFLSVLVFMLVACAPSEEAIQIAIAQTQTAAPTPTIAVTPTPTAIPLSQLNLEETLLITGDLPPKYYISVIHNEIKDSFSGLDVQPPAQFISFITATGEIGEGGQVHIFLYDDLAALEDAYTIIVANPNAFGDKTKKLSDIGEKGLVFLHDPSLFLPRWQSVIFVRCHALVWMGSSADTVNYSQRLDKRLQPFVCR